MNNARNKRGHSGAKMRRKKLYIILKDMFLVTIVGMLVVNLLLPSRDYSASENRSLAGRPAVHAATLASGKFFKDFNTYYSDQFAGRDQWMNLKTLGITLMGTHENNGVLFGKHGYLMQYPTTPSEDAVKHTVAAINQFATSHTGITETMIVVPDAATVLSDQLPANAPVRNQAQDIRDFQNQLDPSIQKLDAETLLRTAAEKDQVYYRTDHHWTSFGAYSVFRGAAELLEVGSAVDYQAVTVSDSFQGTLASRSGKNTKKDSISIYEPQNSDVSYLVTYPDTGETSASMYVSEKLNEKDHYQVFFGGNHPLVEIRTTADNQRNLMIFKDSYANSFVQFLTPYFEKIIMVDPRYYYDNIDTAITTYGITDILYLYSADTLLTDTGLADTLSSGQASAGTEAAPIAATETAKNSEAVTANSTAAEPAEAVQATS